MKKILITILLIMSILPAAAKTLTGGVVYTVESAREAAFEGIEYEISMEPFKKYMKDPGFIAAAKTEGGKPRVSKRGRRVVWFSNNEYAVTYHNDSKYDYYYKNGKLIAIVIHSNNTKSQYPYISKKYDRNGALLRIFYTVGKHESFGYTRDKSLTIHWNGKYGYDEDGKIIRSRKY